VIIESELWKEDLVKIANKLLKRLVQKKWSKRSWFCLEKEIFIGFFAVRKLIESNSIPRDLTTRNFKLLMFPRKKIIVDDFDRLVPYDYVGSEGNNINIRDICTKFIHSYHISPSISNGTLIGFFINSEYQSKKGIYLITILDIVEIFCLCAGHKGVTDHSVK